MIVCGQVNTRMGTEDLLDMISSVSRKKNRLNGDLRVEVMLKNTFKWADQELKRKQQCRKRKWDQVKYELCKRSRQISDDEMEFIYTTPRDLLEDPLNLNSFFEKLNSSKKCKEVTDMECGHFL
ncbi:uncharacterized protein LOC143222879 [Tachypleus tridentatus]|uniref:uncharacterized protein LOC143222879 n=1 Tax=Tachypleus tridentatus TaxID=6853 RepID=UPI003FD22977